MRTFADVCGRMLTYADAGRGFVDESLALSVLRDALRLPAEDCQASTKVHMLTQLLVQEYKY
jgi:hypothetical protein